MSNEIKYLIKFCAKEQYADDLICGKLYMNAAAYYRHLEKGQGDVREGAISDSVAFFKNGNRLVYCLYSVMATDIVNGKTVISKRVIDDFECANGWAVIIEYEPFLKALSALDNEGHSWESGPVSYGRIAHVQTEHFLVSHDMTNLFIKHPDFAYQKEYRIVVNDPLQPNTQVKSADDFPPGFWPIGKKPDVPVVQLDSQNPYGSKIYVIPDEAWQKPRKLTINSHLDPEGDCHISL